MERGSIHINIEDRKTALLEVCSSSDPLGVLKISSDTFRLGFTGNLLYEVEYSLVNETIFIESFPDTGGWNNDGLSFSEEVVSWLSETCCDDFSLFTSLPVGKYLLVKTCRKPVHNSRILLGNTWIDAEKNILCFSGSEGNEIRPLPGYSGGSKRKSFYSLIVGNSADSEPCVCRPLLSVIVPDYGIVWEGATGFIFFSTGENREYILPEKEMLLVIPLGRTFVISPSYAGSKKQPDVINDINSFIKII